MAESAIDILKQKFEELGLSDLWSVALQLVKEGYDASSPAAFITQLEATDQYKERFKANQERIKNNLKPLTPREYVELENTYAELMSDSGLPPGFYDSKDDWVGWISKGVAPTEVERRIQMASESMRQSDPEIRRSLQEYYGVGPEGVVAYFLDADRATKVLDKQYRAASFNAAGMRYGMPVDQSLADMAVDAGVDEQTARAGFEKVASESAALSRLGDIYGEQVSQSENVAATFNLGASGEQTNAKKRRLASRERAAFSGASGVTSSSLSRLEQV